MNINHGNDAHDVNNNNNNNNNINLKNSNSLSSVPQIGLSLTPDRNEIHLEDDSNSKYDRHC